MEAFFTCLMATQLAQSVQPLVPECLVILGGQGAGNASPQTSLFQTLISILTTWQATQQVQEEKEVVDKKA
jgi:hypothetical protein